MKTFKELGLQEDILQGIEALGFENPSPIQEEVIPFMLNNEQDLVGLAQTGTGKTAAFGLPMLQLIDTSVKTTQGLVLAPTRELGVQIAAEITKYSAKMPGVRVVAVYGGEEIRKQLKQLERTPHIIVATPGRLIDLINRRRVDLSNVNYLALDEADEMLKMGFVDDITTILESTPENRRTLLFSATMPKEIARISKLYMTNAKEITVGNKNESTKNVTHYFALTQNKLRYQTLKRLLDYYPNIYGIVFCRTRQETKDVSEKLMVDGYNADALHGDLSQAQRDTVMNKFRIKNLQILVATDVAARGLDVNDLTHVINYNMPDDNETYTHRSGRTGRVNKKGISIAIVSPRERNSIRGIEKVINRSFEQLSIPSGLEVCKRQVIHLTEKMQQVEVNEKLYSYLPEILEQLSDMPKDEIISRFVSLEFNRFLDYYKNAVDLNAAALKDDRGGSRGRDRGGRDRGDRPSRRDFRRTDKGDTIRLKVNKGRHDGYEPKRLLGLINDVTGDRSIEIGGIEVTPKFTFFDVNKDDADRVKKAFSTSSKAKEVQLNDVKGEQRGGSRGGSSSSFSKPRRDNNNDRRGGDFRRNDRNRSDREHRSSSRKKRW